MVPPDQPLPPQLAAPSWQPALFSGINPSWLHAQPVPSHTVSAARCNPTSLRSHNLQPTQRPVAAVSSDIHTCRQGTTSCLL